MLACGLWAFCVYEMLDEAAADCWRRSGGGFQHHRRNAKTHRDHAADLCVGPGQAIRKTSQIGKKSAAAPCLIAAGGQVSPGQQWVRDPQMIHLLISPYTLPFLPLPSQAPVMCPRHH